MKKFILITLCVFYPFLLIGKNSYFFYYKGEKQSMELDTAQIFVSALTPSALQKNKELTKQRSLSIKKEEVPKKLKQQSISDFYWTKLDLDYSGIKKSYYDQVKELKQQEGIEIVSPYFIGSDGKKAGLSNFFYVKLKSLSDTILLDKYSRENKVIVVEQDVFMPLWFILSCTKETKGTAMDMSNQYYESGLFQSAEPDFIISNISSSVNDPYFPDQWGLYNTGQYGGTPGVDINVSQAWDISTGSGVKVAIIDFGLELEHPDLQRNIYHLSYDAEQGKTYDANMGRVPSLTGRAHGTACAGIIGAVGNNSQGIKGVAPDVKLMSVNTSMSSKDSDPADVLKLKREYARGINWAWDKGAGVISNSWNAASVAGDYIDDAIANAIHYGRNGLGCIVVVSSGNDDGDVVYPGTNPNVITVGAINSCGKRKKKDLPSCDGDDTWGSNYGPSLDVVAPGIFISTTDLLSNAGDNRGGDLRTDYEDGDYTRCFNGTSAACPFVSGLAALILSVKDDLTGQQVRELIESTAQKVSGYDYKIRMGRHNGTWNNEMGYGLIDAHKALRKIDSYVLMNLTINSSEIAFPCQRNVFIQDVNIELGGSLLSASNKKITINKLFKAKKGSRIYLEKPRKMSEEWSIPCNDDD